MYNKQKAYAKKLNKINKRITIWSKKKAKVCSSEANIARLKDKAAYYMILI